jgi:putative transposase
MCDLLQISRAAYYAWIHRSTRPREEDSRKKLIEAVYQASHRTYGYRRIQITVGQRYGVNINHKAVLRLMNQMGIHSIARKRRFLTKKSDLQNYHCYPNRLNREFLASQPNQKWVTDVTFVPTQQGWAFLSMIKDLHDGFIVAHSLSRQNSLELVMKTMKLAMQKEMVTHGLLLHSDQGFQYTSQSYFVLLREYNITPSMSRRGNCWDNAVMENFFGHLKQEALSLIRNPLLRR